MGGHKPDLGNLTKKDFDLEKYASEHVFKNPDVSKENKDKVTKLIALLNKKEKYISCVGSSGKSKMSGSESSLRCKGRKVIVIKALKCLGTKELATKDARGFQEPFLSVGLDRKNVNLIVFSLAKIYDTMIKSKEKEFAILTICAKGRHRSVMLATILQLMLIPKCDTYNILKFATHFTISQ